MVKQAPKNIQRKDPIVTPAPSQISDERRKQLDTLIDNEIFSPEDLEYIQGQLAIKRQQIAQQLITLKQECLAGAFSDVRDINAQVMAEPLKQLASETERQNAEFEAWHKNLVSEASKAINPAEIESSQDVIEADYQTVSATVGE